jgi:hypothetical protein
MFTGFFDKFMYRFCIVLKKINIFANGTPKIRKGTSLMRINRRVN